MAIRSAAFAIEPGDRRWAMPTQRIRTPAVLHSRSSRLAVTEASGKPTLTRNAEEDSVAVTCNEAPRVDPWTSFTVGMLSLLPIASQL